MDTLSGPWRVLVDLGLLGVGIGWLVLLVRQFRRTGRDRDRDDG